jgi:hypothetical protein
MCGNIGSRFGGGNEGEGRCCQLTDPVIIEGYLLRSVAQIGDHECAKAITSLKKALDAMGYGKPTGSVKSARALYVVSCLCLQAVCHEKLFLDPKKPDLGHACKALSLYVSSWKSLLLVCGHSPDGYNVKALTASPLGALIGQRILSMQQVLLRHSIAGRPQEPPPALRATTVTKESMASPTTSIPGGEYLWSHPTSNRVQKVLLSMGYLNRDKSNRDKSFSSRISLHVSPHDIDMSMQCSETKTVECGEQMNLSKSPQKLQVLLHHGDRDDHSGDGIRSEIDAFVNAVRDFLLMDEDAACVVAPASSVSKTMLLPLRVFEDVWDESRGFSDPSPDPMCVALVAPGFFFARVFCYGELEGRSLEGSYHGTSAMLSTDALHEVGGRIGTTCVCIFVLSNTRFFFFLSFYVVYSSVLIP